MAKLSFSLAIIIIAGTGCSTQSPDAVTTQTVQPAWDTVELEIYKILFAEKQFNSSNPLLVRSYTVGSNYSTRRFAEINLHEWFPDSSLKAALDFQQKNIQRQPIPVNSVLNLEIRFVSISDEDYLISESDITKYWDYIMAKYETSSNFMIGLSRVGLNEDKTEALVYMDYVYSDWFGTGYYYFFMKVDGNWELISEAMVWIT